MAVTPERKIHGGILEILEDEEHLVSVTHYGAEKRVVSKGPEGGTWVRGQEQLQA